LSRSDAILDRLMGLHPKLIDLSLGRIERLLKNLEHPENYLPPVIHVAGTNAKGSVIAYLRAIFEAAGKLVHVYSSPHLVRFHERIRVAGKPIPEDALAVQLEECEAANGGEPITFFEITTAAAFLAFARQPADVLLMETGLGGRLDATNVVARPRLTVITPVSMDHQQFLGSTLSAIAMEKAGILKADVPCILAAQAPDADTAIRFRAEEMRAPLYAQGNDWSVSQVAGEMIFEGAMGRHNLPLPNLAGAHQVDNAGIALATLERFRDVKLSDSAVAQGLTNTEWPGRLQRLKDGPLISGMPENGELWLDGGHNPAAGLALAQHANAHWQDRPLHLIGGMMNSKDCREFLVPLAGIAESFQAVAIPDEVNSLGADELAATATSLGMAATPAESVTQALATILSAASGPARVLICGSLYLAGTVLADNG